MRTAIGGGSRFTPQLAGAGTASGGQFRRPPPVDADREFARRGAVLPVPPAALCRAFPRRQRRRRQSPPRRRGGDLGSASHGDHARSRSIAWPTAARPARRRREGGGARPRAGGGEVLRGRTGRAASALRPLEEVRVQETSPAVGKLRQRVLSAEGSRAPPWKDRWTTWNLWSTSRGPCLRCGAVTF